MSSVEIFPVSGVPEVKTGSDIANLILAAWKSSGFKPRDGDVVVVKQKIVSKAEGRLRALGSVVPGRRARSVARAQGKDPRLVELILAESTRVVRAGHGVIITETRHGFICANSGVDQSNVEEGFVALLPLDPDQSAARIRARLVASTGRKMAVVITDTFGRPWPNIRHAVFCHVPDASSSRT